MRRFWSIVAVVGALTVATGGAASGAQPGHDKAIAQAGVLTLSDFPAGWSAAKPQSGGTSGAVEAKLILSIPACRPFVPLIANTKTSARAGTTSDFTDGVTTVSNDVRVYPTVARALVSFDALQGPALGPCFQRLLKAALKVELVRQGQASKIRIVDVSVQHVNPNFSVGGDAQGGFAATITLAASGQQESVYVEVATVRVGRALDNISYQNANGPVTDLVPSAVMASVSRLQAALSG